MSQPCTWSTTLDGWLGQQVDTQSLGGRAHLPRFEDEELFERVKHAQQFGQLDRLVFGDVLLREDGVGHISDGHIDEVSHDREVCRGRQNRLSGCQSPIPPDSDGRLTWNIRDRSSRSPRT